MTDRPVPTRRSILKTLGTTVTTVGMTVSAESFFFVRSMEPTDLTVERGDPFDIQTTILNASLEGTQTVEYQIDESAVRRQKLTLGDGEEGTITFEGIDTGSLASGIHSHGIYTNDTSERGELIIKDRAVFEIASLSPRLKNAKPGRSFQITARIENTGNGSGTQTIRMTVRRKEITEKLSVPAGESRTVTVTATAPETAGRYSYTVRTDDDTSEGAITVSPPPQPTDDSGNELLVAAFGSASVLALYGAYRFVRRRKHSQIDPTDDRSPTTQDEPSSTTTQDEPSTASFDGNAGESTVVTEVIETKLTTADETIERIETHLDANEYEQARDLYREATETTQEAKETAREFAPRRVQEIQRRLDRLDELETVLNER